MTTSPIGSLALATPSGRAWRPGERAPGLPGVRSFQCAFELPAVPEAVPPARRELHTLLCGSGLTGTADAVTLAGGELMANAVTHGCRDHPPGTTVTVTVTCDGRQLRLTVEDPSSSPPCVRAGTEGEESGRGMLIVDALADRWGVEAPSTGCAAKAVWMELACAAPPLEEAAPGPPASPAPYARPAPAKSRTGTATGPGSGVCTPLA
ncbi:ATP-binding protein [Streptomyces sp. NPDC059631]|uniref:ATP-binding protein n=1 Tax=unclassified Streptomyces TaxID=2593676 RepID=UPI0036B9868C